MPIVGAGEDFLDVEISSAAGVQAGYAPFKVAAQCAQLGDMREQLLPNLLLGRLRQCRNLRQGAFKRFDHRHPS
jgi:hypothetical protein